MKKIQRKKKKKVAKDKDLWVIYLKTLGYQNRMKREREREREREDGKSLLLISPVIGSDRRAIIITPLLRNGRKWISLSPLFIIVLKSKYYTLKLSVNILSVFMLICSWRDVGFIWALLNWQPYLGRDTVLGLQEIDCYNID